MEPYITLLSTPDYLPGVIGLARSLRATGTSHPLFVALSDGIGPGVRAALEREQLPMVDLPPTLRPDGLDPSGAHHWQNTFDKLHLFGLVQFRKLVYLDSDMMVLSNIDELFDRPHMSAVAAGRLVHPDWVRLNSGLMVIEPQAGLPGRILGMLETAAREAQADARALGDQDLINAYYAEWPRTRLQLDEAYNVLHPFVDQYVVTGRYSLDPSSGNSQHPRPIKVIHFIGNAKPWSMRGLLRHLMGLWRGEVPPVQRKTFQMYRALLRGPAAAWA